MSSGSVTLAMGKNTRIRTPPYAASAEAVSSVAGVRTSFRERNQSPITLRGPKMRFEVHEQSPRSRWRVYLSGTPLPLRRGGQGREYASKASARRRLKQICQSRDLDVHTCWAVPVPEED